MPDTGRDPHQAETALACFFAAIADQHARLLPRGAAKKATRIHHARLPPKVTYARR
jgi:hypothetical protein